MIKKTYYQTGILERFIPVSLDLLISDLLNSRRLTNEQHIEFKQFCNTYIALFHAQTHAQLQHLTQLYQPHSPDRDTVIDHKSRATDSVSHLKTKLYAVLEKANYQRISENDINEALNKISPHGVKVSVDFEDFAEVALFYRGSAIQTKLHRNWKHFSFKKQAVEVLTYRRLFVLLQPKNRQQWIEHFTNHKKMSLTKAKKQADATLLKLDMLHQDETAIYLKLFKDIPRADLEMQFPNTQVHMRLFDKIKLAVTGGGGAAGGVMATLGKFSAALDPVSALIAIGGLLAVIWRQIAKVFSQRAKYSALLTKNLYFYTLDNNMGVINHLLQSAEAEECKEAILAYYFLLLEGASERKVLDQNIETYIQEQYAIPMNFEIEDGLDKLEKSELLIHQENRLTVESLQAANIKLKQQWSSLIDDIASTVNEEKNDV